MPAEKPSTLHCHPPRQGVTSPHCAGRVTGELNPKPTGCRSPAARCLAPSPALSACTAPRPYHPFPPAALHARCQQPSPFPTRHFVGHGAPPAPPPATLCGLGRFPGDTPPHFPFSTPGGPAGTPGPQPGPGASGLPSAPPPPAEGASPPGRAHGEGTARPGTVQPPPARAGRLRAAVARAGGGGSSGEQRRQHGAGAVPGPAVAALPGALHLRPHQQHPLRVQARGADEG